MAEANDPELPPGVRFVGKFVLDVILYTLRACGHERRFLLMNASEGGYSNPNFVRIAAVSVLRICLPYRDKWKENISKLFMNVSEFDMRFFAKCFVPFVERAQKDAKEALQLNVEITLAIATEMALYLYSNGKALDLMDLVGPVTSSICCLIESPPEMVYKRVFVENTPPVNFKKELENLFSEFENIWELLRWIEEFIRRYAIPYESREAVSAVFYREVGKRWKDIVERMFRGGKPSNEAVITNLGFLPSAAYYNIVAETSVPMPKYSAVAWGRKLSKSPASSEGGKKSSKRQSNASGSASTTQAGPSSKDSSKKLPKSGQSSKDSSKASQGDQGGKDSSKQTVQGEERSKDSSKQTVQGEEGSKDSSEQGGQSSKGTSDPELVEATSRTDLSSEGNPQASQGAIQKRKDPKK